MKLCTTFIPELELSLNLLLKMQKK
jgi:hypothetical protein